MYEIEYLVGLKTSHENVRRRFFAKLFVLERHSFWPRGPWKGSRAAPVVDVVPHRGHLHYVGLWCKKLCNHAFWNKILVTLEQRPSSPGQVFIWFEWKEEIPRGEVPERNLSHRALCAVTRCDFLAGGPCPYCWIVKIWVGGSVDLGQTSLARFPLGLLRIYKWHPLKLPRHFKPCKSLLTVENGTN